MDHLQQPPKKDLSKKNQWKNFWNLIIGRTIYQQLFRIYLLIIIIGACLLAAPFSLQTVDDVKLNGFLNAGGKYNFWKALFIACSGFSSTGLSPVDIYRYLNPFGQVVLMILIEIGSIGVIVLFYVIGELFSKNDEDIGIQALIILQNERGSNRISQSFKIAKTSVLFILAVQFIFLICYSLVYCFIPAYEQIASTESGPESFISYNGTNHLKCYHNYGLSLWNGLFSTVSAFGNAGFDNVSSWSLSPYRNDWGIIVQFLIASELIIGGIGHVVAYDIIQKIKAKHHQYPYKISLFSKIAIITYFIVLLLGFICCLLTEFLAYDNSKIISNPNRNGEFGQNPWLNKIFCILFNSIDARCLGMPSLDPNCLTSGTKWIYVILMFIGGSPSSAAGGIRTTTLAVIFLTIFNWFMGQKKVNIAKKQIPQDTITMAFMIMTIALVLITLMTFIMASSSHKHLEPIDYIFEALSAFGTVGLSLGITSQISWWGLLSLISLMFIGQLGIINFLLSWTKQKGTSNSVDYPLQDIKVG